LACHHHLFDLEIPFDTVKVHSDLRIHTPAGHNPAFPF
jgi:hypothetical protein